MLKKQPKRIATIRITEKQHEQLRQYENYNQIIRDAIERELIRLEYEELHSVNKKTN